MPPTLASSDPSSDRDFGVPSDEYDAALGRWNTVFLATLLWSGVCSPRPPARVCMAAAAYDGRIKSVSARARR